MAGVRPSGAWQNVISDPNAKSYEVAGANAKEWKRLREAIEKAERERNYQKVDALKEVMAHVERVGRERHQNMPVSGVMYNTSRQRDNRARDKEGISRGEQARRLRTEYLWVRSKRILFENAAHRGDVDDPTIILKNREKANTYREQEDRLKKQYDEIVQTSMLKGDQ